MSGPDTLDGGSEEHATVLPPEPAAAPARAASEMPATLLPSTALAGATGESDRAGQRIAGRYLILGRLGEGGMGTVYRARDLELEEIVALKMLRPDLLGAPDALERFRREVKLARRVTHRSVARTFDIGEHDGARFLTMELVTGEPLSRRLARYPSPALRESVDIAVAIADGLDAAHVAGVVHRDLKPENVMLADDGRVVIMDFGVARALEADGTRATGSPIGTPAYMAPEQLQARGDIDGRADVYALGVMLFEMCTGRPPFQGDSAYAIAAQRLTEPPPDPSAHRADLPNALANAIRRCLARDPAERFPTAHALAEALRDARVALPTMARSSSTPTLVSMTPADGIPASLSRGSSPSNPRGSSPSFSRAESRRGAPLATTPAGVRTLAVLPLLAAPDDAYLADGVLEDVVDQLSMTPALRVRPRSAVARFRSEDRDAESIGRELGVQWIVDGTLRRRGDVLRVSVRLVSTSDGFQTWARKLEKPASELAALVDEVGRAVAEALTVPAHAARRMPTAPEALDLYFRARHEYHRLDAVGVLRAVELFDRALELAPDDPAILTGSALARVRQWFFGGVGAGDVAEEAALRAVEAAPDRGEPHVALASVRFQQGRPVEAVRALREALRKAPALAEAHELLGRVLAETGPIELALGHLRSAAKLDPVLYHASWTQARLSALLGRWDEAEAIVDRTAREAGVPGGWLYVARLAVFRGDVERARRALAEPWTSRPENETATRMLRSVTEGPASLDVDALFDPTVGGRHSSGRSAAFFHQVRAELLARAERRDDALDALSRSSEAGLLDVVWLERCPLLVSIRDSATYVRVKEEVDARAREVRALLD